MSKQGKNQAESSFKAAFPQEKTEALAIYLDKKGLSLERSLGEFLEKLYEKNVPGQVREYLAAKRRPAGKLVLDSPEPPARQEENGEVLG